MTGWLIDTSALVRLGLSPDAEPWADRIDRALVRIAGVTRLEIGYSARSGPDLRTALLVSMPLEYQTPAIEDRAIEVQTLLADTGRHRAPSVPDLIVAAPGDLVQNRRCGAARLHKIHSRRPWDVRPSSACDRHTRLEYAVDLRRSIS